MSKPTAAVKNRWNEKNYDRITIIVKKGTKDKFKEYADSEGMSLNAYIVNSVEEHINNSRP